MLINIAVTDSDPGVAAEIANATGRVFADVVVNDLEKPEGEATIVENGREVKDLIKRVVGLPGETVTLQGGEVFIDGERLEAGDAAAIDEAATLAIEGREAAEVLVFDLA